MKLFYHNYRLEKCLAKQNPRRVPYLKPSQNFAVEIVYNREY